MANFKHFFKTSATAEFEILIASLLNGEVLATRVSKAQARYFKDTRPDYSELLLRQARQESFHAKLFKTTLLWLNPKSALCDKSNKVFDRFEQRLMESLQQQRPEETVLGLQIMIECVGEASLSDLDCTLNEYQFSLRKIRDLVLSQERAHHGFGQAFFISMPREGIEAIRETALSFRDDIESMLYTMRPAMDSLTMDSEDYLNKLDQELAGILSCQPQNQAAAFSRH